jgi:hypothetical protein
MKYVRRQHGIAQLLVVGLVALVLAVVGLAVWQSQKAKQSADKTSTHPTASPIATASTTPAPTATSNPNEIGVTELGYKMTLPAGLMDLKYVAQTNLPGDAAHPAPYSTSSFTTASLLQLDGPSSQCTAANGAIGTIVRYAEDPKAFASVAESKKVGNFYLGFVTPQQTCSSGASTDALETSQLNLLRQAFKTATAL